MMISVQRVTFPKPGGKFGNITGADGRTVWVPPELMGAFRVGETCEIGTQTQTWGRGTATERMVEVATTGPGGQGGQVAGYQAQAPQRSAQAPRQGGQPLATAAWQGGNSPYQPQTVDKERSMYVMGVVGRAMGSGKFAASEITVLTQAAIEAWDRLMVKAASDAATVPNVQAAATGSAAYASGQQVLPDPPSDQIPF